MSYAFHNNTNSNIQANLSWDKSECVLYDIFFEESIKNTTSSDLTKP